MKFISSREIRSNPVRLWEVTGSDESVITVNGKPRAIVVAVGEDLEVTLASLRRAPFPFFAWTGQGQNPGKPPVSVRVETGALSLSVC